MRTTLIVALVAFIAGGTTILGVTKAVKPVIKLECPRTVCPEQKPCNGIDFDKIKSKAVTIQNTQYLTVNGDTVLVEAYINALRKELSTLRLARCK